MRVYGCMMVRATKHDAIAPIRQFASAPFALRSILQRNNF